MSEKGYAVEWQGKTLRLGDLSADRQEAFCTWLKPRMLDDAAGWMTAGEYSAFRQELTSGAVYWDTLPCPAVATALRTKAGTLQLNRLLFGDDVKDWTDDALWQFLKAKDDKTSDYSIAFDLVWDAAHPKAQAPTKAGTTSTSTPTSAGPADTTALSAA